MFELFDSVLFFVPLTLRIIFLGVLFSLICMSIYFWISPQNKILTLKVMQKESRRHLRNHEGNFTDLYTLIWKDLKLTFLNFGLIFFPALISMFPLLYVTHDLGETYNKLYSTQYFYWLGNAEIIFFTTLIAVSLVIKRYFKIH